jgi:hypothetical protein
MVRIPTLANIHYPLSTILFASVFLFLFPVSRRRLRGPSVSVIRTAVQLSVTKEASDAESKSAQIETNSSHFEISFISNSTIIA